MAAHHTSRRHLLTTAVTATSRVFLTVQAPGTPAGYTSTLAWLIVEPA